MKLNLLWATLAGAVTMMLLGFLFYVVIFGNLLSDMGISDEFMKEPDMLFIFLGNVAGALLLAYSYSKWANISTFKTGAQAGAVFGLLISLYAGLIQFGTTVISSSVTPYLVDALISAVLWAIAGGVVGFVLGKTASE